MTIDISFEVKARDFLGLCQRTFCEYQSLWQGKHGPSQGDALDVTALRSAAEKEGCLDLFERDMAVAPLAISSRAAILRYSENGGKFVYTEDDCSMFILKNRGKDNEYSVRVSSPIIIGAEGHNTANESACLQLLVRSTTGAWNEIYVPRKDLVGGAALQGRLQDAGVLPGDYAILLHILQNVVPLRRFERLEHAGWTGDYYSLPSGEVLPRSEKAIATFQPVPNFGVSGTREEADKTLVALAGNDRFVIAIAAALAAPFVAQVGATAEPGGFHFYGTSSRGKTTLLTAAASVWGCGAEKKDAGIVESWNTTSFAAEITASQHSDCAMYFDEIRAADPQHFAKLALGLANGAGKRAGKSDGGLRDSITFRPTLLSTGEISSKDYIETNDLAYHGGMSVRIVDIKADAGTGLGIFNIVPSDFVDAGAFADWIKERSAQHYGHHGRAMVEAFMGDRELFLKELHDAINRVNTSLGKAVEMTDPQSQRVCKRIAFVAAVAIVGCDRKIIPWLSNDVLTSAQAIFEDLLETRGGKGSQEGVAAEQAFSAFIYANPKRFDHDDVPAERDPRVGMTRLDKNGRREWWIPTKEGLIESIGSQPERLVPFVEHLRSGVSSIFEIVEGKNRVLRDSPVKSRLPKRSYCIRTKAIEQMAADNDELEPDLEDYIRPRARRI
jgi:uncharacterized protein (DUF927 family)